MPQQHRSGRALLLACAAALLAPAAAAPLTPPGLFTAQPGPPAGSHVTHPFASGAQYVILNKALLEDGPSVIGLNAFGKPLRGVRRSSQASNGKFEWFGSVDGADLSSAVFVGSADGIAGTIRTLDKVYEVAPVHGAVHVVWEIDPNAFPDELPPKAAPPAPRLSLAARGLEERQTSGTPVIDVLVVYTTQARIDAGSDANIRTSVNLAVTETNEAYLQSGVNQRLRLVYAGEVAYTTAGFDTDLARLQSTTDGFLDEVHALRNQYGADLVSLIITDTAYCGLGYLNGGADWAFTVVSRTCATGYYSFGHELGHNQGLMHDRANAGGGSGAYSFSFGYQDPNNRFRTILAYNCPVGCPRLKYFSNPNVLEPSSSAPMGVSSTAANSADNAQSLNLNADVIAAFRAAIPPPPVETTTSLTRTSTATKTPTTSATRTATTSQTTATRTMTSSRSRTATPTRTTTTKRKK
ncbi:Metallo-peptidase family M12B Reprolysin-like-domain-containing protein [Hyaloraphidium curvatum]|nr:Metallo-peptidase family M12B Reprolysin-like-domain-containing protein [Hyaloraphidium curvatum]